MFEENEKSDDFFQDFENEDDLDVSQIVEIVKTFVGAQHLDVCAWGSSTLYNEMMYLDESNQENCSSDYLKANAFQDDKLLIAIGH